MKITAVLCLALFSAGSTFAQNPPAPAPVDTTTMFAIASQAVAVRIGGQSVPGTDVIGTYAVTKHVSVRSDNLLAPGNNLQLYGAGFNWRLPLGGLISKTNLPKNTFEPYLTGTIGIVRNVPAAGAVTQRYAGLVGGGVNYDPAGTGRFTINLVEVRAADLPGFGKHPWGATVSVGIKLGLWQKQ